MLKIDDGSQHIFNSMTYRIQTPDGTMFVNIMEDKAGKICGVDVSIGKAGAPLKAWAQSISRVITLALDRGSSIEEIVTELSSQTSDRSRNTRDGIRIRSGPEGIYHALMMYRKDKFAEMKKVLGMQDGNDGKRGRFVRR